MKKNQVRRFCTLALERYCDYCRSISPVGSAVIPRLIKQHYSILAYSFPSRLSRTLGKEVIKERMSPEKMGVYISIHIFYYLLNFSLLDIQTNAVYTYQKNRTFLINCAKTSKYFSRLILKPYAPLMYSRERQCTTVV